MAGLRMLFSKVKIGSMELKNRICMGEIGAEADENGYIAQRLIDFYVERARGGAGLIMIGGTCPDISGIGGKRFAKSIMTSIYRGLLRRPDVFMTPLQM